MISGLWVSSSLLCFLVIWCTLSTPLCTADHNDRSPLQPYDGKKSKELYSSLLQFLTSQAWPEIRIDDPLYLEKTEALEFLKTVLVYDPES